ncbi:hypothetical protein [Myceligenerans indicum]|uniref:Uncharacterized protein n=1 Tax=Myceligenerans indicum TaxID=2593663 RepID=A0ABS1LRC9_9MICO|nr:hypothetical protein [Myceligenerans indicum]MBL0888862.1 hypothetical protein [Myceligenerans indicum]
MTNLEATESSPSNVVAGREPADGECRFCGSTPAVKTTQQGIGSFLIFYRITTWRDQMCRSCAEAVHRDANAKTMTWGWWGLGGIMFWMFLLGNAARMRAARALDHPRRTAGVAAPLNEPMVPGEPWFRRRAALVATCIGGTGWLLLVAIVVAALVLP